MDNNILTVIIASASALLGGTIPALFTYMSKKKDYNYQKEQELNRTLMNEYVEYIQAMQNFMNSENSTECFLVYQNAINKVLLLAKEDTANIINEYFQCMIKSFKGVCVLTQDDNMRYHTAIINSMRKDLAISKNSINKVGFISLRK